MRDFTEFYILDAQKLQGGFVLVGARFIAPSWGRAGGVQGRNELRPYVGLRNTPDIITFRLRRGRILRIEFPSQRIIHNVLPYAVQ